MGPFTLFEKQVTNDVERKWYITFIGFLQQLAEKAALLLSVCREVVPLFEIANAPPEFYFDAYREMCPPENRH